MLLIRYMLLLYAAVILCAERYMRERERCLAFMPAYADAIHMPYAAIMLLRCHYIIMFTYY